MSQILAPVQGARLPRRLRLLILVAVLVTGLTAYGVFETLHYSAQVRKVDSAGSSVGFFRPRSTRPVPFSLPSLTPSGGRTTMSQLLGKPVVVNMWSSSCTICTSETPAIEGIARVLGRRVTFVGVDSADQRSAALAFVRKYGVTYRQLFDPTAIVATGYGIPGLPVTVFVTAAGKVVGENIGALSAQSLRHYLFVLFKM